MATLASNVPPLSTTTVSAPAANDAGSRLSALKELVTTVLALGISAVSLYMLLKTFWTAGGDPKIFAADKDVLLYGLSLFGTVLGYYFGRVPAELHAQQATAEANKAQGQLTQAQTVAANAVANQQQTKQQVRDILTTVKQNLLSGGAPPVASMKAVTQSTGLQQAVAEIDEALKTL